jgi:hypothetical protein
MGFGLSSVVAVELVDGVDARPLQKILVPGCMTTTYIRLPV